MAQGLPPGMRVLGIGGLLAAQRSSLPDPPRDSCGKFAAALDNLVGKYYVRFHDRSDGRIAGADAVGRQINQPRSAREGLIMQRRVLAEEVKPPSTPDHFHERHALSPKITPSAAKPPFFAPIIKRPTARERFPISPRSQLFRKCFFPEASALEWSDWRWQVRSRVKDLA